MGCSSGLQFVHLWWEKTCVLQSIAPITFRKLGATANTVPMLAWSTAVKGNRTYTTYSQSKERQPHYTFTFSLCLSDTMPLNLTHSKVYTSSYFQFHFSNLTLCVKTSVHMHIYTFLHLALESQLSELLVEQSEV